MANILYNMSKFPPKTSILTRVSDAPGIFHFMILISWLQVGSFMAKKIPFIVGSFNYDGLTHSQRICRLYRASLQNIWSYEYRDMEKQRRDMLRVRYLIDKNKDVSLNG